ncbi:hypothetical protein A5717_24425 [Mycolicibacterium porcinum]|uniref:hypothetical protein n=1 Tax=Mycolicibacterium porcinum TaxID=39693 RepID=UPI00080BAD4B|nr:hypothetical protein [Mycolicibacterium porcinum]OCB09891.1 hypothetical protein A5717_24425 [Mycolicibacterium porcinum]
MRQDPLGILASVRSPLTKADRFNGRTATAAERTTLRQTVIGSCESAELDLDMIDQFFCVGAGPTFDVWSALPSSAPRSYFSSTTAALRAAFAAMRSDHRLVIAVVGISSENRTDTGDADIVDSHARQWAISPDRQYSYTVDSYRRATECARQGDYRSEIVPIHVRTSVGPPQLVAADQLRCVKVVVRQPPDGWGDIEYASADAAMTNRYSHGAMSTILMTKYRAASEGRAVRGYLHAAELLDNQAPLRVSDEVFDVLKHLLEHNGLNIDRLDHIEIYEDTAVTPLIWCGHLGLARDLVNPRGGALALGSCGPADGLRALSTALVALRETGGRFGLVICAADDGTGAVIIEKPSNRTLVGSPRQDPSAKSDDRAGALMTDKEINV